MALAPIYNWQTRQIEFVDDQQGADGQGQQEQSNGFGGALGNIGGMASGQYVANQIFGGGAAASSAPIASSAASSPLASALGGSPVATALDGGTLTSMSPEVIPGAGAQGLGVTPYLGLAGAGLGAYGLYNNLTKKPSIKGGAMSGAALGGGLAAAAPLLLGTGPVGWGVLGLATLAGALGGGGLGAMGKRWNPDEWQTEQKRLKKLRDRGIAAPEMEADFLSKGRSMEELRDIEQKKIDSGKYGNLEFATSRNESSLKPEDIWGYSSFLEKFGNDWLGKFDEAKRRQIAKSALESGAVREHHGTVDVDWDKVKLPE
jgi:hypothetical protein